MAGLDHSLALSAEGRVWVWGRNDLGQLGLGYRSEDPVTKPVELENLGSRKIVDAAAGTDHTLLVDTEGKVYTMGSNLHGQLGLATFDDLAQIAGCDSEVCYTPARVDIPEGVLNCSAAGAHSLALTVSGRVYSWGYNRDGQLGLGDVEHRNAPLRVRGESDGAFDAVRCKLIAAGGHAGGGEGGNRTVDGGHTLCVAVDNQIWAWGDNKYGSLGMGQTYIRQCPTCRDYTPNRFSNVTGKWSNHRLLPQRVGALGPVNGTEHIVAIAAGSHHSVALTRSGQIWAWGRNDFGQLGLGYDWRHYDSDIAQVNDVPRRVTEFDYNVTSVNGNETTVILKNHMFTQVDAGYFHTVALDDAGVVYTWGTNEHGELGECPSKYDPETEVTTYWPEYKLRRHWRDHPGGVGLQNYTAATVAAGGALFALTYSECPDDNLGNACSNNGECNDKSNECRCELDWRGQYCHKQCPVPGGEICFGAGVCVETRESTECICEPEHFGRGCDLVCPRDELGRFCSGNGTCLFDPAIDPLPYCNCDRYCVHPTQCVELGVPEEQHDFEKLMCLERGLMLHGIWCSFHGPEGYDACYGDGLCGICQNDATALGSPARRRAAAAAAVGAAAAASGAVSGVLGMPAKEAGFATLLRAHVAQMTRGFGRTKFTWGHRMEPAVGVSCLALALPALAIVAGGCGAPLGAALFWILTTVTSLGSDYFYGGIDSPVHGIDKWVAGINVLRSVRFGGQVLARVTGSVVGGGALLALLTAVPLTCFYMGSRSSQAGLYRAYVLWHSAWHYTAGAIMATLHLLAPCDL